MERENDNLRRAKHEIDITLIEQEKKIIPTLIETRRNTYPLLIGMVYRIRNQLRTIRDAIKRLAVFVDVIERLDAEGNLVAACKGSADDVPIIGLWQLTEDLYKYRVFIHEETFEKLHSFKRVAQDIVVQVNRALRPSEKSPSIENFDSAWFNELAGHIDHSWDTVVSLHSDIAAGINTYFGGALERAGLGECERRRLLKTLYEPDSL